MTIPRTAAIEQSASPRRFGWPATIALHLAPGAVTFAAALLIAPLLDRVGLPRQFSLIIAFALLLTPIELTLLLRASRRVGGRSSLRALPSILAFGRPAGRWLLALPLLLGFALALSAALSPFSEHITTRLAGVYPAWTLTGSPGTIGVTTTVVLAASTLVVDGLINPTVEELYFRGYLLPRLPVAGWRGVPLSAAFFAVQHFWQPYNWVLIFALQLLSTTLVVRSRSLRLGIAAHVLANSFGIIAALLTS